MLGDIAVINDTNAIQNGEVVEMGHHHLEPMADIFKSGQWHHNKAFPNIFCEPNDHDEIVRYLRGFLKPKNPFQTRRNFSLVWTVDDEARGYVLYQLYRSSNVFFGRARWTCFVDDIAIDSAFRGRGGASMLMETLIKKVETLPNCVVSGQVWKKNDASEALFRKFGFSDEAKTFYRTIKEK